MLAAFACSVLFLISYLVYHYQVGSVGSKGRAGFGRLLHDPSHPHHSGRRRGPAGAADSIRALRTLRRAPAHRPLDLSHLVVCFGDRCGDLSDVSAFNDDLTRCAACLGARLSCGSITVRDQLWLAGRQADR